MLVKGIHVYQVDTMVHEASHVYHHVCMPWFAYLKNEHVCTIEIMREMTNIREM